MKRDGSFLRIRTAYDYTGWVHKSQIGLARPGDWAKRPLGTDLLEIARRFKGAPYKWGGVTERGADCSGLFLRSLLLTGRAVRARDCWQFELVGQQVPESDLQPGHIITYQHLDLEKDRAGHMAIYAGQGRILHATDRPEDGVSGVVEEEETDDLRRRRRRVLRL